MIRKRTSTWTGVLLGAIIALALTAAAQAEVREEFHKTYPLTANGRVELSNINGSVQITVWDKSEVKVDAVKHANEQPKLDAMKIEIDAQPDSISIRTKYPHHTNNNPGGVDYTLTVPRNARINKVSLVNGNLTIEGTANDVSGNSVNGHVTVKNASGPVNLSTVNGPVEASFSRLGGKQVALKSVNGSLSVTLPSNADAEVSAETLNGRISNDFGIAMRRRQFVGRSLQGTLGSGETRISLNNVNGSIEIRRADDGKPMSKVTSKNIDDNSKL